MVELHDLAGDGRLECAVVIYITSISKMKRINLEGDGHGKSGRVALPRVKLVLVTDAALLEAPALRADRATAEERKSVADMIADFELREMGTASIDCLRWIN